MVLGDHHADAGVDRGDVDGLIDLIRLPAESDVAVLVKVIDETTGRTYRATRMPPVMADILSAGGLVPYLKAGGDYSVKQ